jgi:hypothetical protein
MDESEIRELFTSAVEHPQQDTDAIRRVFSLLVKVTLKYRDDMLASKGLAVTVEDVRTSLGWLIPALTTGELPDTDRTIRLDLLRRWLKELKSDPHITAKNKN